MALAGAVKAAAVAARARPARGGRSRGGRRVRDRRILIRRCGERKVAWVIRGRWIAIQRSQVERGGCVRVSWAGP